MEIIRIDFYEGKETEDMLMQIMLKKYEINFHLKI